MKASDILALPSMPAAGPSYPAGPYRFVDRGDMVRRVVEAHRFIADLTLPCGRVLYDYLQAAQAKTAA